MKSTEYNNGLATKWLSENGILSTAPRIAEQLPVVPLNRYSLRPFGYNCSIARFNKRTFLAYRYHTINRLGSQLSIAELDAKANIMSDSELQLVGHSLEDSRFFTYKNELWIAWVDAKLNATGNGALAVMKYGKLIEGHPWTVKEVFQPKYGQNDWTSIQKNWVFFEHQSKLYFIYQAQPKQIVVEVEGNECPREMEGVGPWWSFGAIKGGTHPVPFNGKLLRFFHSTLDNEDGQYRRRYYVGACLMENEPPFNVIATSKSPILRGSELDALTETEKSSCGHYKKLVVFPGGVMPVKGGWLLSVGVNDSACAAIRIKEEDLKL